jgi:nucleoside-diphosphate-sugar epimerase
MLEHLHPSPISPSRAVIVGAGGFVGSAASERLKARGVNVLALTSQDIDLLSNGAACKMASILREFDTLVFVAARAPVKNNDMLVDNLRMASAICTAVSLVKVAHLVYISSDAVYADSEEPLKETSCAEPGSLHGVMHLAREVMLRESCKEPVCILRPTLIYGARDPHNGYGPNRFRRLAQRGEEISLFGSGEEKRDHVYIDDVAEIIARCVVHKSQGILNIATGTVASFADVAKMAVALVHGRTTIKKTERSGPMPHRGYRAFESLSTTLAFPDFCYTSLDKGLALSHKQEFLDVRN